MTTRRRKLLAYDTDRIVQDMARKGWEPKELAAAAGVSHMTVSRFLRGQVQTVKTATRLSGAMGRAPGYYLLASSRSSGRRSSGREAVA